MSFVQFSWLPLISLPIIALCLLSLTVLLAFRLTWISSLSLGFPGVVGLLWVATELQVFRAFSRGSLVLVLAAVTLAGATTIGIIALWKRDEIGIRFRRALTEVPWSTRFLVAGFLALDALLIVILCFAEPNNWDSMTYHLPRVEHWLAQGSVSHYSASDSRQLFMPPLGGYLQLWVLQVLNSYFVLASLQFVYFNLLVALGTYLTWSLFADRSRVDLALLTGILIGTTPILVAQATTTQVDLLSALLPVLLIGFLISKPVPHYLTWIALPLIVGIASAVKQYALIAVVVIIVWAAVFRFLRARDLLAIILGSVVTLALFLGPQIARNLHSFGSPLGPSDRLSSTEAQLPIANPQSLLLNVVMYTGINLPIPSGVDLRPVLEWLSERMGFSSRNVLDLFQLNRFFPSPGVQLHEDSAPNPVQFILGTIALCALILSRHKRIWVFVGTVGLSLLAMQLALTLGGIGTVRYLIGLFVLACVALVIILRDHLVVLKSLVSVSLIASIIMVANLEYRPLVGKNSVIVADPISKMFLPRPSYEASFREFVDFVDSQSGTICVDLDFDSDAWEFPIWWLSARNPRVVIDPPGALDWCDENVILRSRSDLSSYLLASVRQ